MISHRMQTTPIAGYYEYLSRNRHRVSVALNEETMTETTNTNSAVVTSLMDEPVVSLSSDNVQEQSQIVSNKNVTDWTSTEVQHWVEEQCQKFELKKATTEQFQLNGQALVLLTKDDFLRRSPDGGEILYYALQRMINPKKNNSARLNSNFNRNGSARQSARITEVDSDSDDHNSVTGSNSSPSSKPIIEEPDDPPLQRKSESDSIDDSYPHQRYPRSYFRAHPHMHQHVYTVPTAAYYYQQPQQHAQVYPNTFVYPHQHVPQQQFYHAQPHVHFIHQYQPMMAAQGILIELINHEEAKNLLASGANSSLNDNQVNGVNIDAIQGQLYLITMNGQRYIMNEEQIRHYANEFQQQQQQQHFQHQMYHQQQQQQQHFQQQMFHHHQQQQQQQQQQRQTSQDNIFYTTS